MQQNNKLILKNTVITYINLLFTFVVGLFSSRYILKALGVSDYGLYNVVGSVIGLYGFISGSLSATTGRFMNFERGKENGNLNRMFNICNELHIGMAVLIFIISETFGIWYIDNYLNVAPGKLDDAMFVFQISIIVACIGIINVPYSSLYGVYENYFFPTVLGMFFNLLRLCFIFILLYYDGNRLRLYASVMSLTTLASFIIYHYLAYRNWHDIVRWKPVKGYSNFKPLISYASYNALSTVSMTARGQGSNLLINFFFGTAVNAAYGIASAVQGYIASFVSSFDGAAGPQIMRGMSGHKDNRVAYLANNLGRLGLLLVEIVVPACFVEMDFILHLWLGTPPEGSATFCRLCLLIIVVSATGGGILQVINGCEDIKWFKINASFWFLICLPAGYISYKLGAPPYTILIYFIITDVFQRAFQLMLVKKIIHYNVGMYIREAYSRPGIIFLFLLIYCLAYFQFTFSDIIGHIIGFIMTLLVSSILVYTIGLKKEEKKLTLRYARNKLTRK